MKRLLLLLAIAVTVMAPRLTASPDQSLQVHTATGELVWCTDVRPGDVLRLQFTHSMYGGFVREQWRIGPDRPLHRQRIVTQNAAAAEYYATDGTSYRDTEGFVVPGDPLQVTELVVRVNDRGKHQLTVGNPHVDLFTLLPQSTQVRITVEPQSCD